MAGKWQQVRIASGCGDLTTVGAMTAHVDYILEIPLELAEWLVGFTHDEVSRPVVDNRYVVLSAAPNTASRNRIVRCVAP